MTGLNVLPANAKSNRQSTQNQAIAARQKKLDTTFSKININKVAYLTDSFNHFVVNSPSDELTAKSLRLYKTTKPFKVTNEFKHKLATLPAGTVVQGFDDGNGNILSFSFEALNTNKQRLIHKQLGSIAGISFVNKNNGIAKHPYTRTTAFAYKGSASLPILHQIKGGLLRASKYHI
mgnify:CR=1 FL=1